MFRMNSLVSCHKESENHILVDKVIAPDEVCVRCVLYPKMRLNKNSADLSGSTFLPNKRGQNDVSILRLRYCSEEFAVKHGEHIAEKMKNGNPNARFWGLAELTQQIIDSVNEWALSDDSIALGIDGVNGIQASIEYKPMFDDYHYVTDGRDVYLDDQTIEFPMHADLIYSRQLCPEVQTRLRNYTNELLKRIKFKLVDEKGLWSEWQQEKEFNAHNRKIV